MKLARALACTACAAILGTAAIAESVSAADPQSIADFFFGEGIPSQIKVDAVGDPMIEYRVDGREYTIFFYDCSDGADCTNIQFYRGYETDGAVSEVEVNALNYGARFVRFLYDDEDDVLVTLDVYTGTNGMSFEDFGGLVDSFDGSILEFEETVNWVHK